MTAETTFNSTNIHRRVRYDSFFVTGPRVFLRRHTNDSLVELLEVGKIVLMGWSVNSERSSLLQIDPDDPREVDYIRCLLLILLIFC